MQYNGGKFRQVAHICPIINSFTKSGLPYYEPFVGGLNIPTKVVADSMHLSDGNLALVNMWNAALSGFKFPDNVSEVDYRGAYELPDEDPLKAFILIGCSFGGIYKGGFARGINGNYAAIAKRGIEKKISHIRHKCRKVEHILWEQFQASNAVIYLDPPYASSRPYPSMPKFDSTAFWTKCNDLAKNNIVLVSECDVPNSVEVLWERTVARTLGNKTDSRPIATEKLVRVHHA